MHQNWTFRNVTLRLVIVEMPLTAVAALLAAAIVCIKTQGILVTADARHFFVSGAVFVVAVIGAIRGMLCARQPFLPRTFCKGVLPAFVPFVSFLVVWIISALLNDKTPLLIIHPYLAFGWLMRSDTLIFYMAMAVYVPFLAAFSLTVLAAKQHVAHKKYLVIVMLSVVALTIFSCCQIWRAPRRDTQWKYATPENERVESVSAPHNKDAFVFKQISI